MSVAGEGANPGEADLVRLAAQIDLPKSQALDIIDRAKAARAHLPAVCRDYGIKPPRF